MNNPPSMLDQLLIPDDPLNTDVLHVKPISHQICRGITYLGTTLQQSANPNHPHGQIRIGFAKGIVATGYVLNTIIALVESIAALTFAALALSLHAATKGRSTLIQKITLKMCAYYINTLLIATTQIVCLKKGKFSRHHTLNAAANHAIHATAALAAQFVGFYFDERTGRNPVNDDRIPPAIIRALRVIIEIAPTAFFDISTGAARDFAVHIRNNKNNPSFQVFLRNNPNYEQTLNRFNFTRLLNDQYRAELFQLLGDYLVEIGILNNQVSLRVNQINAFAVSNNDNDRNYQNSLKDLIKKSCLELHDNPKLARMLSKEKEEAAAIEDGRDQLTSFLPAPILPLAHYAQLKELQSAVACPAAFAAKDLQSFNNRHQLIKNARDRLSQLTVDENQILIEMLLKTGSFEIKDQKLTANRIAFIQSLFNDIGTLAGPLHQGLLLSQKYVNTSFMAQGNINEAFGSNKLFNSAWQEAVKEIGERT